MPTITKDTIGTISTLLGTIWVSYRPWTALGAILDYLRL